MTLSSWRDRFPVPRPWRSWGRDMHGQIPIFLSLTLHLGLSEDVMCPDPPPDDVRLTRTHLLPVVEGCSAVWRPRHLPHAFAPLHPLDAKSSAEPTCPEVRDEPGDRLTKKPLCLGCQCLEVTSELRTALVGRHLLRQRLEVAIEGIEELLIAGERLSSLASRDRLIHLALPGLPLGGPEPCLLGVDLA